MYPWSVRVAMPAKVCCPVANRTRDTESRYRRLRDKTAQLAGYLAWSQFLPPSTLTVRATVIAIDHARSIIRIDPESVVVAVRCAKAVEVILPPSNGMIQTGVGDVDRLRVLRISPHVREIPGPLTKAVVWIDERPVFSAAVG